MLRLFYGGGGGVTRRADGDGGRSWDAGIVGYCVTHDGTTQHCMGVMHILAVTIVVGAVKMAL